MAARMECHGRFRVWTTLKQMCHDRGYLVAPEDLDMTYERFEMLHGDKTLLDLSFHAKKHGTDESLMVYMPPEKDIKSNEIKHIFFAMKDKNCYRAIVVAEAKIHNAARDYMRNVYEMTPSYKIEIFLKAELMYNVTRHNLVPKHEVLTEEDKATLLQRYNMSAENLPRMMPEDPIARYFGLEVGQVVRIVRRSSTAGRYVTYRIVHTL